MEGLRVMKARRKRLVLDEGELEDPIAEPRTERERHGETPKTPTGKSSAGRTRKPSRQRTTSRPLTDANLRAAELLAGKSEQVAVRLDDELWTRVVQLAEELTARGGGKASTTAVLATALAFACPEGEAEALSLVARYELEPAYRRGAVARSEHNVRLPAQLRRRLDALAKPVRAAGFAAGRSALVNAALAVSGPGDAGEAAEQLDGVGRARAGALLQPDDAGAASLRS